MNIQVTKGITVTVLLVRCVIVSQKHCRNFGKELLYLVSHMGLLQLANGQKLRRIFHNGADGQNCKL